MRAIPKRFLRFIETYPKVGEAYQSLGEAVSEAGPLDSKTQSLIKLAIALGSRQEGATHSHTRKALDAGASHEEIRHAVLLSLTTIGFPNMMTSMSWVEDVLVKDTESA